MGRETERDVQKRSSGLGLEASTRCQESEPMWHAPGPVGQRAPHLQQLFASIWMAFDMQTPSYD